MANKENIIYEPFNSLDEQEKAEQEIKCEIERNILTDEELKNEISSTAKKVENEILEIITTKR